MKTTLLKTAAIALVAGVIFAGQANACLRPHNPAPESKVSLPSGVQLAGYYDRARAYIRRSMRRRFRVRTPSSVAGVRG